MERSISSWHFFQARFSTFRTPFEKIFRSSWSDIVKPRKVCQTIMFGRRHSDGIGLGNRIRTCPETLHLFVEHINAELCCFAVILIEEGAIFLHREVYEDGIPIHAGLIDITIAEISLHQIARYLVEERTVGKRLHNQGLSLNVNRVYR